VILTAGEGNRRGWEEGEELTFPTIIGHRDVGSTSCPGQIFYDMFPLLRRSVVPEYFGFEPSEIRCEGRGPTMFGTLGTIRCAERIAPT
jgi:hypothetical protein